MSDNYLIHWGLSKGQQSKNHKYIARVKDSSGYRYFYTQAELTAYKAGKSGLDVASKAANKVQNGAKALFKTATKSASNAAKSVAKDAKDVASVAKEKGLKEAITGSHSKNQRDFHKQEGDSHLRKAQGHKDTLNRYIDYIEPGRDAKTNAKARSELRRDAGQEYKEAYDEYKKSKQGADTYNKTIAGKTESAAKKVSSKLSKAANKAYSDASDTAYNISSKAKNAVRNAKEDIESAVSNIKPERVPNLKETTKRIKEVTSSNRFTNTSAKVVKKKGAKQAYDSFNKSTGLNKLTKSVTDSANEITSKFNKNLKNATKAVNSGVESVGDTIKKATRSAANAATSAIDKVDKATSGAQKTAKSAIRTVNDTASNVAKNAKDTANNVSKTAKSAIRTVNDTANNVSNTAKSAIRTAENTANKVSNTAKSAIRTAENTANNVASTAKKAAKTVGDLPDNANKAVNDVKKAFSDNNLYNVTPKNYKERKAEIQKTKEWQDITKDKKSEYAHKNSDGSYSYDFDQYLVDKKHPVLKAVRDLFNGKKVDISNQSASTLVAGAKDYIRTAVNAANFIGQVSYSVINAQLKNSQGSYETEKKQFKKAVKNTASTIDNLAKASQATSDSSESITKKANEVSDLVNKATKGKLSAKEVQTISEYANNMSNGKANELATTVKKIQNGTLTQAEANKLKKDITDAASKNTTISKLSSAALKAYAQSQGVDEAEARSMLRDASMKTINYYLNNY